MGASSRTRISGSADWASDVAALADALGIDRFVVAGHSTGGPYAVACPAIVGLKTVDFHVIFPDVRVGDSKQMEQYSKQFLESNEPPYDIRVTIKKLTVSENKLIVVAEVLQEATRYRELEGRRRRVDTSVVQRETWAKATDGWKLKSVDGVRDQKRFVDGKRVDPTKPYDPDAPPYNPDDGGTAKP